MTTETLRSGAPRLDRRLFLVALSALIAAAVIVLGIALAKHHRVSSEARQRADVAQAGPRVLAVQARRAPATHVLDLQGEARPYLQTTLYAKIPGYLRRITVDKGDRVTAGQVLGRIESPETERQVQAARANAINKRDFARRYTKLASKDFVSVQDAESAVADARVAAEQMRQLEATNAYAVLRAPFDGVVTQRYADPGAYLGGSGAAMPVVELARDDRLRVFAYVDQRNAQEVRLGDVARVMFPGERQPREAPVARIAGALDPRSRMLLVEIDLPNQDHAVPGGYVDVALTVKQPPGVEIPADALLVRGEKTLVAVVDPQDRLRYRPVDVVDSDGKTALVHGVEPGQRVAVGVGESAAEGAKVQPVAAQAQQK